MARIIYLCPGCESPLVLRRGDRRACHFAHRSGPACSPETALHRTAKALIARTFRRRLSHRSARLPRMVVPCFGTGLVRGHIRPGVCPGQAWFDLSGIMYDEVAEERSTVEGLRPDVLLLDKGQPVLGIEVLVTHAVDAVKAARTGHPWVELDASRLLAAPWTWRPCGSSHPWRGTCRDCHWGEQISVVHFSDDSGPGEAAAELAAAWCQARLGQWLGRRIRGRPGFHWRCPSCLLQNRRFLVRERMVETTRVTSLGPPILPEVRILTSAGAWVAIQFESQARKWPWVAALLPDAAAPVIQVHSDCRHPLRLQIRGTNRPQAFLCPRCGCDCCGTLPPPWVPLPSWATLASDP